MRRAGILLHDDPMVKRVLRGVVKSIGFLAALVFFFDNKVTGTAGTVLLGSIVVCFVCLFVWAIFLRDDEKDGNSGYWPRPPQT
jgi:dolichyl-phosphate-mannose--protein O-mannosyl transferase